MADRWWLILQPENNTIADIYVTPNEPTANDTPIGQISLAHINRTLSRLLLPATPAQIEPWVARLKRQKK